VRREGAPIPMKPLPRWDNGRDVVLAGDAAGVVAPASGEGIYYAMARRTLAADAAGQPSWPAARRADLAGAQALHAPSTARVFWVLGIMQRFWYSSDKRRERFVASAATATCSSSPSTRTCTSAWCASKPMAHVRIFFKDMAHLLGLARVT
jgi:geranylgeranyl reductase